MDRLRLDRVTRLHESRAGERAGVRDVSLAVRAGEVVALCGRSGSGKSTLLGVMGLLDRAQSGHYWLDDHDVTRLRPTQAARVRGRRIGFVFQSFQLVGRLGAADNVALPALYAGQGLAAARRRARSLLAQFDVGDLWRRRPDEMSGGQRQRVALCRALVNDPDVVLADEPTGNLDSASASHLVDALLALRRERGCTLVLVTHDAGLAARADRVLRLADGRLVAG